MPDYDKLQKRIEGDVLTGIFDRGRYATDASIYQIMPRAVVVPKSWTDVEAAFEFSKMEGIPFLPRGGGTSQSGQTVNDALVVDFSKHLNRVLGYDHENGTVEVEPGLVLDDLNRSLKKDNVWFPVDVSTASRATLGGMAANNSCGSRSIRYGKMSDNVISIEAMLSDQLVQQFGEGSPNSQLTDKLVTIASSVADHIEERFPKVSRRVGGYNIDELIKRDPNFAHLLVGSEGTLGITKSLKLKLSPTLKTKRLGVCHFPTFHAAMDAAQHIVKLGPVAVELVDHNMIRLGRDIPQFRPIVDEFVRGEPEALLLVEFAESPKENARRLKALDDLMAELGFRWGDSGKQDGGVVDAEDPAFQARIWGVRAQGLNIMMSMRTDEKPVSFVEDCAVPLEHLAEFTDRLTAVFRKHGTDGTWYAHASVGLLHVRPVLNLRKDLGAKQMRAIAEEAFDMVSEFKGSHSGEHGDGIVRSEFHEKMYGREIVDAFEKVKDLFDPQGILNPGKIIRAPKMDNRELFRWPPDYEHVPQETAFDWGDWPDGLIGAVEMCNNNGACRKSAGGVMCPSYRATRNEKDLTRGRANTLRNALTGRLGKDAFASDEMAETMKLCVSCKACKSECPMSVDMAKMKVEVQAARVAKHGLSLRERVIANLPKLAPLAAKFPAIANLPSQLPGLTERVAGISSNRNLPKFTKPFEMAGDGDVLIFADTFNRHFEPETLHAAKRVMERSGKQVCVAGDGKANLCCGRTYLSAGLVDKARDEMKRATDTFRSAIENGKTIVGLEPSCVLTFRDEAVNLIDGWTEEMGNQILTFSEFIHKNPIAEIEPRSGKALIHGHCHQKAFGIANKTVQMVNEIPEMQAELIDSSCCGMAGPFGYQKETDDVSRQMGELTLAPAIRNAPDNTVIIADGFSCRCQIKDLTGRNAIHSAVLMDQAKK